MKTSSNTVLITGGATGIGFALAKMFTNAGNQVIICGRREHKLIEAQSDLQQLRTKVCDVTKGDEHKSLFDWIKDNHKDLNILVNNAGIQRAIDFHRGTQELFKGQDEIETNLIAPIQLSTYFTPFLLQKSEAAIINVSSALGFVPIAAMPVYCATKAAIHSFTMSLRYQLKDTSIKVFEIIPPAVDTELGKGNVYEEEPGYTGIPPSEVAEAVLTAMAKDEYEIVVGEATGLVMGARNNPEQAFQNLNQW